MLKEKKKLDKPELCIAQTTTPQNGKTKQNKNLPKYATTTNPAVALLHIYPREIRTYVHRGTCKQMFTGVLLIIAPSRNPDSL